MAEVHQLPIPQHSIEAEQAVLGALLISTAAWPLISAKLAAADFYRADHRLIYSAIAALHDNGRAVDTVTVTEHLERQGTARDAGGLSYIGTLARDTPTASNVEAYAAAVRERSALRRLKSIGEDIAKFAQAQDGQTAEELAARAQEQLQHLQGRARTGLGLIGAAQLIGEFTDDLDARAGGSKGLQVGLPDFDELTCGLEPGDLVVLAARPSMGKTATLVSIASTTSQTVGTAVISAEMPARQLMRRCVALHAQIPQGLLRRAERLRDEHWAKISTAAGDLAKRRLWIDDTSTPTLAHIRAEALALNARSPLGLVLIDYVQLVRAPGKNRYEELRDVSYGLKALATEIGVPMVVLAQLNRSVESRDHKRPNVSDLRDSGAIEEAADIVALLYSEAYYDKAFAMPYVLECEIAKNRNGERGHCVWRFDGAYSHIQPLESGAAAQYRRLISQSAKRGSADL